MKHCFNLVSMTRSMFQVTVPKDVVYGVVSLFLFRHIGKWNQTGDKWLSCPDIGDWLILSQNSNFLGSAYLLSCAVLPVLIMAIYRSWVVLCVNCVGLFFVIGYHASAYKIGACLFFVFLEWSWSKLVAAKIFSFFYCPILIYRLNC